MKKDRSSSSVALFLHAAVLIVRLRLAVVCALLDDEDSSACVCWLLFLSKSLIHRIFGEFVGVQMFFVSFSVQFVVVLEIYCPGQS